MAIVNILGSSSNGNAIVYHDIIMVDIGLTYSKIKKVERELMVVLLTHRHRDHVRSDTIKQLLHNRPSLLFGVPEHLVPELESLGVDIPPKNMFIINPGSVYRISDFLISSFELYHNVKNVGYRIIKQSNNFKILHATDTYSLEGIEAKDYDIYAIEHNYDADTIGDVIMDKIKKGQYSYEVEAVENHLSFQKADEFYQRNRKDSSELIKLHVSSRYYDEQNSRN